MVGRYEVKVFHPDFITAKSVFVNARSAKDAVAQVKPGEMLSDRGPGYEFEAKLTAAALPFTLSVEQWRELSGADQKKYAYRTINGDFQRRSK